MNSGLVENRWSGASAVAASAYDVLLVDDEADVLLVTGETLRTTGLSVLVAQNASRAMQQLENPVRVIVLDINLAGENGLQLMDYVKRNNPEIPVVLYTGLEHDDAQVLAMLDRGATCYVHKTQSIHPLSVHDLLFAVHNILGRPWVRN